MAAVPQLSGGMRRRVEVARALLHDPELLLLDEPTTGIDPGERAAAWELLRDYRNRGGTILLATNDLAEADAACDLAAFIRDGAAIASGTPGELKAGLRRDAIRIEWPGATQDDLDRVAALDGVGSASFEDDILQVSVDDAKAMVPRLFALAPDRIRGINIHEATLEDAYFQHVAHRARHAEREAV
ncbi:MAG: ATP-binding cassette domain-containing protein [Dehalococcoidia bacterium]|nr:ATP-binding cassette domain-containing protein [Dehalococcoidia bacterium]